MSEQSSESGATESSNAGASSSGTEDTAPAKNAADVGGKPDYVPDNFWDTDTKQVKVEDLLKSYKELGGKIREKTDDVRTQIQAEMDADRTINRPEAMEDYELVLSDDFKEQLPEGYDIEFNNDDPLMTFWREMAFEQGMNQESFQKGLELYAGAKIGEMPDFEAELGKLGDNGHDRTMHVGNWAKANFSDDTVNAMHEMAMTADGVIALEEIMAASGEASFSPNQHQSSSSVTMEDLRAMQADPRYWDANRRDPGFVRKVEEGYRQLVS